jgi:hypothetical protein
MTHDVTHPLPFAKPKACAKIDSNNPCGDKLTA